MGEERKNNADKIKYDEGGNGERRHSLLEKLIISRKKIGRERTNPSNFSFLSHSKSRREVRSIFLGNFFSKLFSGISAFIGKDKFK